MICASKIIHVRQWGLQSLLMCQLLRRRQQTCALLQRRRMASTGGRGSTSCSIFTQLRRIIAASVVEVAITIPGQSRSLICLSRCTCWRHLKYNRTIMRGIIYAFPYSMSYIHITLKCQMFILNTSFVLYYNKLVIYVSIQSSASGTAGPRSKGMLPEMVKKWDVALHCHLLYLCQSGSATGPESSASINSYPHSEEFRLWPNHSHCKKNQPILPATYRLTMHENDKLK